jgi:hypothetical protein
LPWQSIIVTRIHTYQDIVHKLKKNNYLNCNSE